MTVAKQATEPLVDAKYRLIIYLQYLPALGPGSLPTVASEAAVGEEALFGLVERSYSYMYILFEYS